MTQIVQIPTPAQLLCDHAADLLEKKGWTQGNYEDGRGRHCLMGAINAVFSTRYYMKTDTTWDRADQAIKMIADELGTGMGALTVWNDRPGRTADEVIGVLRKVASA